MDFQFRPISTWPGERTKEWERKRAQFRSSWSKNMKDLERELRFLGVKSVVFEADTDESQIRLDGMLRADAKVRSPGIIVSFESKHGPLRYPCDAFTRWEDNLRAICLALESLRRVDRYGVTKNAEQYRGWKALPGNGIQEPGLQSAMDAAYFLSDYSDAKADDIVSSPVLIDAAYKRAAMKLHPDRGGSAQEFAKLEQAKRLLYGKGA